MEDSEEHDSIASEPQEQSEGSSSEQSNAEDDEWRPCRRKVVRRVNLQRSQATKLMWQRKRAAALLQQQEKQQEQDEGNPGVMGPSRSSGLTGTATTLDRPTADIGHTVKALAVSAGSKCKSNAAQQQPPTRRRRFPAKASETASSGSSANGSRGRTKRMPSLNMTWQQRKLARLRLSRFKTRDPLSRAIFRRDPVRFSMCWSDTTLGSSFAGKPSLKPKEESNKNQKSSFLGLKPYHHISAHSAAGRAEIVEELPTNEMEFSEVNARPYLERACRPKMFQKDESSGSEASEDDECDSTAEAAEKMSDTDTDESVIELPPERLTLRPKLLQPSRSRSYSRPHSFSQLRLGEARKEEFRPAQCSINKMQVVTIVRGETPRPGPRLICRGNYVAESELLAQGLSLSRSVPSIGFTTKVAPAFTLPAKLRWKQNSVEHAMPVKGVTMPAKWVAMPAKLRHKRDKLLSSAANGESHNTGPVFRDVPGTSSGCSVAAPLGAAVKLESKEPPSERRSRAKRLWWEQIKQLDLRLAGGGGGCAVTEESVADLLNSLPKFLLAELFPDQTSTRKRPKKIPLQPDVPAATSRRSLIMKENWRKRKEAWLSAAAQTLAAASQPVCAPGTSPPSTSTEQREDSGPTEDRNQYLARSLALLRCRQYRHDLIAQMDLQQRYCDL